MHRRTLTSITYKDKKVHNVKKEVAKISNEFFPKDNAQEDKQIHLQIWQQVKQNQNEIIDEAEITFNEVMIALESFNDKKAPGEDHITIEICKQYFLAQPQVITSLYNKCLALEYFPKKWKEARILLIPKPSVNGGANNNEFRPIGLLPVISKIFEKIIHTRLMRHIYHKQLISKHQYGFMPSKSSEAALKRIIKGIQTGLQLKRKMILISIDIKGAFNNTWWPNLILRLRNKFNVGKLIRLIENYLADRTIKMSYEGEVVVMNQQRGCVQGSVLGPLLWNIIIDEVLQLNWTGVEMTAYADDITLVIKDECEPGLYHKAQQVLDYIHKWSIKNKLEISKKKTVMMIVDRTTHKSKMQLKLCGEPIQQKVQVKILGIIIDSKLTWRAHVKYIIEKAAKVIEIIKRIAAPTWGLNPEIGLHIYKMAFEPIITYAASV